MAHVDTSVDRHACSNWIDMDTILAKKSTDAQVKATLLQLKNDERDYNRYLKEIVPVININWKIDESNERGHITITVRKKSRIHFLLFMLFRVYYF